MHPRVHLCLTEHLLDYLHIKPYCCKLKNLKTSISPFQSYKDFVIFVHGSDLCCGSYEQVSTQALWSFCQYFILTYSLVYITESVFLSFLNASSAQKWKKQKFINQNTELGTLRNGFSDLESCVLCQLRFTLQLWWR